MTTLHMSLHIVLDVARVVALLALECGFVLGDRRHVRMIDCDVLDERLRCGVPYRAVRTRKLE